MVKIIGLDPGSSKIGICVLQYSNGKIQYVNSWQIPLIGKTITERLFYQGEALEKIIQQYPGLHSIGLEETFISNDVVDGKDNKKVFRFSADSPLALSMSRGVVHYIGGKFGLPVYEYSNIKAKKELTGNSQAGKKMIMRAAQERFGKYFEEDESCSLAIGVLHMLTIIQNLNK
jgi:Holliday junction resolvasome RuvABC endonuclease subunit